MTNLLNSTNTTNNNSIAALSILKKSNKKNSGVVESPPKMYQYSMYKDLQDRFEFSRQVRANFNKKLKAKKHNPFKIIPIALCALGIYILSKLRKIK